MTDIERAKTLLRDKGVTCVLCLKEQVYLSDSPGIAPMLFFIGQGTDLAGFSAADKIVGKAAALLFAHAGVTELYGEVMSRAAVPVLEAHGIRHSHGVLADVIINRAGDGPCPMELTVKGITEPALAYALLKERLEQLRGGKADA